MLFGIPFEGKLLVASVLEEVLTRYSEKSQRFPSLKTKPQSEKPFRSFQMNASFKTGGQHAKKGDHLTKKMLKVHSLLLQPRPPNDARSR